MTKGQIKFVKVFHYKHLGRHVSYCTFAQAMEDHQSFPHQKFALHSIIEVNSIPYSYVELLVSKMPYNQNIWWSFYLAVWQIAQ